MPHPFRASRVDAPDARHSGDPDEQTSAASGRPDAARTRASVEGHRYTMPVVGEIPPTSSDAVTFAGQGEGLRFGLLGALEVRRDGRLLALGGPRQRALLAVLLLRPNALVTTDGLIDRLWGHAAPVNAVNALQVQVSRLRATLAAGAETPGALVTCPSGYLLRVGAGELDAERFERLVEEGGRALAAGLAQRAAEQLREALALWRGPALADVANESSLQLDITGLEELRIAALEERIEADLALGRHGALIAELERLVAEQPLRERPRGQLMLALYRCGRQAEALAVYRCARETLVSELGLEPGPALADLERAILRHDPSVLAPAPREAPPALVTHKCAPLPMALAAARETPFVPRARELEDLLAGGLLDVRSRVTLMYGEAGVGKTRLAAELAAQACEAGWTVLYGRADEGAPIAYQPFVEALRDSVAVRSRLALHRERLGPELAAVADVVPGLRGLAAETAPPSRGSDRLFDALAAVVDALARGGPLLLILDDLQWADDRTLLLLRHVLRAARRSPLAVLATYRVGEPGPAPGLAELVIELRRDDVLDGVTLAGFDEAQTAEFVATRLATGVDPGLVRRLRHATGGSPFLIGEVLRELAEMPRWSSAAGPRERPRHGVAAAGAARRPRLRGAGGRGGHRP